MCTGRDLGLTARYKRRRQGSVPTAGILAELPSPAGQITAKAFTADPLPVPLWQVEQAWNTPTAPGRRIVRPPGQ